MNISKKIAVLFVLLSLIANYLLGQNTDTIILKEVQINSFRYAIMEKDNLKPIQIILSDTFEDASDSDISTVLKENSSIDIRQRSFSSVQSDISIRGGSFDQNIILVNGINLSDVQTGHHNLNIPISSQNLASIELISGPSSRLFGPNALTGAVNLISEIPRENSVNIDLLFGSFKTRNIFFGINAITGKMKHSFNLNYGDSEGFTDNTDYNRKSLYYENNIDLKKIKLKAMLGLLDKEFGSNSFYTPMYANQFEKIKTGFAAIKLSGAGIVNWDYNVYARQLRDEFQLFREGEGFYLPVQSYWINHNTKDTITWYGGHNYHLTNVYGSGFSSWKELGKWKASFGADYRFEQIYSNVLGENLDHEIDGLYIKSDHRQNISFTAQSGYYGHRLIGSIGGMAYWNQKYNWNFYYGGDIGYKFTDSFLWRVGVNKAMRLPTFTELYYNGPSNQGNPNLLPEQAITFESGFKYYYSKKSYLSVNVFNRRGEDIIAWVKEISADKWVTENLTQLYVYGFESNFAYSDFSKSFFLNNLFASYSYLYQDKSSAGLESKYTLDQLKHKFILGVEHKVFKFISAFWSVNVSQRNGEFLYFDREQSAYTQTIKYPISFLLNCKIKADFDFASVFIGFYNITNSEYFDIANVPTPGFSFNVGVKVNLQGSVAPK
ncbi:MAG: TonB-dependent receptor [Bacteroidales bacterium]|nr:TonB-dependent receptor [Bacteroidales bacterium]